MKYQQLNINPIYSLFIVVFGNDKSIHYNSNNIQHHVPSEHVSLFLIVDALRLLFQFTLQNPIHFSKKCQVSIFEIKKNAKKVAFWKTLFGKVDPLVGPYTYYYQCNNNSVLFWWWMHVG